MISRPRCPGSRVVLLVAPSRPWGQWLRATFVCAYSCGAAPALHRLPCSWEMHRQGYSRAGGGVNRQGSGHAAAPAASARLMATAAASRWSAASAEPSGARLGSGSEALRRPTPAATRRRSSRLSPTSVQPPRRAGRPREHGDAVAEQHRLAHVVRHQHPRGGVRVHHVEQPAPHLRARQRVEAAERLVEQDEPAVRAPACAPGRRAGACRPRAPRGSASSDVAEAELVEQAPRASPRARARRRAARASAAPRSSGRGRHARGERRVAEHRLPGQQQVLLEHVGGVAGAAAGSAAAAQPAAATAAPSTRTAPAPAAAVRRARCSSVLLPQPLRADDGEPVAGRQLEVDAGEHEPRRAGAYAAPAPARVGRAAVAGGEAASRSDVGGALTAPAGSRW